MKSRFLLLGFSIVIISSFFILTGVAPVANAQGCNQPESGFQRSGPSTYAAIASASGTADPVNGYCSAGGWLGYTCSLECTSLASYTTTLSFPLGPHTQYDRIVCNFVIWWVFSSTETATAILPWPL